MTTTTARLGSAQQLKGISWRGLDRAAESLATLADQAEQILAEVAHHLESADVDRPEFAPMNVQADRARRLAVGAARLRHAAISLQVVSGESVEESALHFEDASRTPRRWLAEHCGIGHREASSLMRCALARRRFPLVDEAFLSGGLTPGHLDAIAGIIPARFVGEELAAAIAMVSDIQSTLVEVAANHSVDDFTAWCRSIRDRLDHDGPADPRNEPSRVWLSQLFNGRWSLSGDLNAHDGPLLAAILADCLTGADPRTESAAGATAEPDPQSDPQFGAEPFVSRPDSERRAEALVGWCHAGATANRPGRVSLYLHIDLEALSPGDPTLAEFVAAHLGGRAGAHTDTGIDIDTDSLWRLLGDADVTPVYSLNGTPLSYGRTRRFAPPVLRRVLAHRDRRCRFPGCDRPASGCDVHHLRHWEHGGTTDPFNCVHLSPGHHHDHHDRGWSIGGDPNGPLTVHRPSGELFDPTPAYRHRLQQRDRDHRWQVLQRLAELRM